MKKRLLMKLILLAGSLSSLSGCSTDNVEKQSKDIHILFTSNLEGRINNSTYYQSLESYRLKLINKSSYVSLVDAGNFSYGGYLASVNNSEEIVNLMNKMSYDFAIFGNGDFAYGVDYLKKVTDMADFTLLGSNITYLSSEKEEDKLSNLKKTAIVNYGGTKVGYIGLLSPNFMYENGPRDYMDKDGKYSYEIVGDNLTSYLQDLQKTISDLKNKGAHYIIALSALPQEGTSSIETVIRSTYHIDALIDGNSEEEAACKYYQNAWGEMVPVTSLGINPDKFGRITISRGGDLTTTLVSNYPLIDTQLNDYINNVKNKYSEQMNQKLVYCNNTVSIYNDDKQRLLDSEENGLGNLIADSFRSALSADVALINSNSIKSSLPRGELIIDDFKKILPYEEKVIVLEASGRQICDALELGAMLTAKKDENEDYSRLVSLPGSSTRFLQVSGLKFDIDTSINSPVILDNGFVRKIDGERRVKNVQILINGEYQDIDLSAPYKVATLDKIANKEMLGFNMFSKVDYESVEHTTDIIALLSYIKDVLHSELDAYLEPQGRINIL